VTTIELPALAAPVNELWHALLDLAVEYPTGWTLIGGQMVLLHAVEHGQVPPQISQDGDVVADVRLDRRALSQVVALLERLGFALSGISVEGLAHRYSREATPRPVVIDVLAPDGLGSRVDLTSSPPGRTVSVPGATQALHRTELVSVVHEGRHGQARARPCSRQSSSRLLPCGSWTQLGITATSHCCALWRRIRSPSPNR
jgi:hypothetical protein